MKKVEILLVVFVIAMMTWSCDSQGSKHAVSNGDSSSVESEPSLTNMPEKTASIAEVDSSEETAGEDEIDSPEETAEEDEIDLSEGDYAEKYSVERNPIDQYFMSQIYSWDNSQVEIRAAQNAYKKAWKAEYKNLMKWLRKKCIYDEDSENIQLLEDNIDAQIEIEKKVLETNLINAYKVNPDSSQANKDNGFSRISLIGKGTGDRLNQCEGEIYRDVSMRIIYMTGGEEYEFQFREEDVKK
ncbi:MAG: RPC7 family DNA-directed RNA polymerase III subunit [Lachnospiraceae bacterium]|nr:RPC7 family DNA-directed RNA polymerase III subunit [Lachnospiraceae bacterium]